MTKPRSPLARGPAARATTVFLAFSLPTGSTQWMSPSRANTQRGSRGRTDPEEGLASPGLEAPTANTRPGFARASQPARDSDPRVPEPARATASMVTRPFLLDRERGATRPVERSGAGARGGRRERSGACDRRPQQLRPAPRARAGRRPVAQPRPNSARHGLNTRAGRSKVREAHGGRTAALDSARRGDVIDRRRRHHRARAKGWRAMRVRWAGSVRRT